MKPTTSCLSPSREGFTLIEMSIVLVIIGLIVGGILVGRDMIRAAELRSVVTDIDRFRAAMNAFKLKYNCIAGDCGNATDYFDADSVACTAGGSGTGTCNGNGDERIDWPCEGFLAWQQLGLANLVGGKFSDDCTTLQSVVGVNIPASRISGVGYTQGYFNYAGNTNYAGYNTPGTVIENRFTTGMNGAQNNAVPFMTPNEAAALDQKIDDGNPLTGGMTAIPSGGPSCAFHASSTTDPLTRYGNGEQFGDTKYGTYMSCALVFSLSK